MLQKCVAKKAVLDNSHIGFAHNISCQFPQKKKIIPQF